MSKRLNWVDVSKAIAIIFIYLGHWITPRIEVFAYNFHLQLFFMVAGFFALHLQKDSFIELLKKQVFRILIPLFLWASISYVIANLDTQNAFLNISDLLLRPATIQPNYWFLPALFGCSVFYWMIYKLSHNSLILLGITYVLFLILGESAVLKAPININFFFQVLEFQNWLDIPHFFTYGFWYALGAFLFPYISKAIENIDSDVIQKRVASNLIGICCLICTVLLFLSKCEIGCYMSSFLYSNFVICKAIIISFAVFYLSYFLQTSRYLNKLGKNTMIMVGMEYITHGFIPLVLLPMIRLGIPDLNNSIQIVTNTMLTISLNMLFVDLINQCFPILNGKKRVHS